MTMIIIQPDYWSLQNLPPQLSMGRDRNWNFMLCFMQRTESRKRPWINILKTCLLSHLQPKGFVCIWRACKGSRMGGVGGRAKVINYFGAQGSDKCVCVCVQYVHMCMCGMCACVCMFACVWVHVHVCMCLCVHMEVQDDIVSLPPPLSTFFTEAGSLSWIQSLLIWLIWLDRLPRGGGRSSVTAFRALELQAGCYVHLALKGVLGDMDSCCRKSNR